MSQGVVQKKVKLVNESNSIQQTVYDKSNQSNYRLYFHGGLVPPYDVAMR